MHATRSFATHFTRANSLTLLRVTDAAEEDDDNMDEIDLSNIVEGGRRTRGKVIDWAKAAENVPTNEEDEDDDDDFEGEGEKDDDKMDED